MGNRVKVRTPRGIRSILTLTDDDLTNINSLIIDINGGSSIPYTVFQSLTADASLLITHNKKKKCATAYYYDNDGWAQDLKVNNEATGNDTNACWIYSGKIVTSRNIYLTFITE